MLSSEKLSRMQRMMEEKKLDALFLRSSVNITALTGYWACNYAVAALIPKKGKPVLIVPESEMERAHAETENRQLDLFAYAYESVCELRGIIECMEAVLRKLFDGFGLATVGIEKSFEDGASGRMLGDFKYPGTPTWNALEAFFPQVKFCDATDLIWQIRYRKETYEVEKIKKAIAIAELGYDAVRKVLTPGMTEMDVSAVLEGAILSGGAADHTVKLARGFSSVYSGSRAADQWTHWAYSSSRVIERDELVILELGVVCDGYWADLTRCMCAGNPSDEMREVQEIVLEAQAKGILSAVPGAKLGDIDRACRGYLKHQGYDDTFFKHQSGHATGFNYHEPPAVHQANDTLVMEGMVLCVEPGLYFKDRFGLRCEDIIYITMDGAKILSEYSHDL